MKHNFSLFKDAYGTPAMRAVWDESNMVAQWMEVEVAIAAAQKQLGLIDADTADQIIECCRGGDITPELIARHKGEVGHIMVATMHAFRELCGPAGEKLHLGATTQDILDTGVILQIRDACFLISDSMSLLEKAMREQALRYRDTAMMGRTHAQHATPVTFGFKVMLWSSELARHRERLYACRDALLYANVSGAVGSNASYRLLLDPVRANAFRALVGQQLRLEVADHDLHQRIDRFVELVQILAAVGSTLGRIGMEIRELQRPEIGELQEPLVLETQYASSTMPNKRNPSLCEWQEALAKLLRGQAAAIAEVNMQHERDATWLGVEMAAVPESFLLCSAALQMANTVFGGLVVNTDQMRKNLYLQKGVAMAEAAMLRLYMDTGKKLAAHRICYEAAMRACEKQIPLRDALLEHGEVRGLFEAAELDEVLNPETYTGDCAEQVERYFQRTHDG